VENIKSVNYHNVPLACFLKAATHFAASFALRSTWSKWPPKRPAKTTARPSQTGDKNRHP